MGYLKRLAGQIRDAAQQARPPSADAPDAAPAGMMSAGDAPPPLGNGHPTPPAEHDAALPTGGPTRGVVTGIVDYGSDTQWRRLTVRPRVGDGQLGDESAFEIHVGGWRDGKLLQRGLEIPITSRPDGTVIGIDEAAFRAELRARHGEIDGRAAMVDDLLDLNPLRGVTQIPGLLREYFTTPTPQNPVAPDDDPLLTPAEGVTWEQYIAVWATAQEGRVGLGFDEIAARYGVAAATWGPADAAFQARIRSTPLMAERFGRDLGAAKQIVVDLRKRAGADWFTTPSR